ncbi:hypothetical protein B566_EDAN003740 [Ephemera danica]|nr:hypothetical protein B566_EDAN003740 [Ephemera danica]
MSSDTCSEEFQLGQEEKIDPHCEAREFCSGHEFESNPLCFSVSKDAYITGVELLAWRENTENFEYEENVEVSVRDYSGALLASASFTGQVKPYTLFKIMFERPCPLSADVDHVLRTKFAELNVRHFCYQYDQQTTKTNSDIEVHLPKQMNSPICYIYIAKKISGAMCDANIE